MRRCWKSPHYANILVASRLGFEQDFSAILNLIEHKRLFFQKVARKRKSHST